MHAMHLLRNVAIRPNLELKALPKQLLGSLPLDITLPRSVSLDLALPGLTKLKIGDIFVFLCQKFHCNVFQTF